MATMDASVSDGAPQTHRPKRRVLQFGLRTLLGLIALAGLGLAMIVTPAERQKRAVATVRGLGGKVSYAHEDNHGRFVPASIRDLAGEDYFRSVVEVVLSNTQVRDADLPRLKGLPGLHELILTNTKIGDAGLESLAGLTELRVLGLSNTQVGDAGLAHLKGLTELRLLALGDTRVTDAGLESLQGLAELRLLVLSNTRVSDAGLGHLQGLTELRVLVLTNSQVSHAGLTSLRASLRRCAIVAPKLVDPCRGHSQQLVDDRGD